MKMALGVSNDETKCGVKLTKMDEDLSKIVWMSGPVEEPLVTNCSLITSPRSEAILLHITDTLHDQADRI